MSRLYFWVHKKWQNKNLFSMSMLPLSALYWLVTFLKKYLTTAHSMPVKIIVIGNIITGGTGKTPLTIAIAKRLQKEGMTVGIISRGYKGSVTSTHHVQPCDSAQDVGDEAIEMTQALKNIPVVIGISRIQSVKFLIEHHHVDIIISDDGLQHYTIIADATIAIVDSRKFGNGFLLPAGPLRELPARLKNVDIIVSNDFDQKHYMRMDIVAKSWSDLNKNIEHPIDKPPFKSNIINTVCAIGNPERFFKTLNNLGLNIQHKCILPDHSLLKKSDMTFPCKLPVIMSAKDATKAPKLDNSYVLNIEAKMPEFFWDSLLHIIDR